MERLAEFFRRLELAPPVSSCAEARQLVEQVLNAVEDEMTSIPYNIATNGQDGRMYPPEDNALWPRQRRATLYRVRGHLLYYGDNGAIEIEEIPSGQWVFSKPGADGNRLEP